MTGRPSLHELPLSVVPLSNHGRAYYAVFPWSMEDLLSTCKRFLLPIGEQCVNRRPADMSAYSPEALKPVGNRPLVILQPSHFLFSSHIRIWLSH